MSKRRIFAFFYLFLFFLVQNSLNTLFPARVPSLVLMVVIFYALLEGPRFGMLLGAASGFLLDLLSVGPMGFFIAGYAMAGGLAGFVSNKIFQESLWSEILLPAVFYYFLTVAEALWLKNLAGESGTFRWLLAAFLPWPLLTTLVVSPVVFDWLRKRVAPRPRRARSW